SWSTSPRCVHLDLGVAVAAGWSPRSAAQGVQPVIPHRSAEASSLGIGAAPGAAQGRQSRLTITPDEMTQVKSRAARLVLYAEATKCRGLGTAGRRHEPALKCDVDEQLALIGRIHGRRRMGSAANGRLSASESGRGGPYARV